MVCRNIKTSTRVNESFDVTMVDLEAKKGRLSFKDALLSKYSFDDEESGDDLCFIHFTGSPKQKGTYIRLTNTCVYLKRILSLTYWPLTALDIELI